MKYLILCLTLLLATSAFGQDEFFITTNGLVPQYSTSTLDHLNSGEMYEKTLIWIAANEEEYKLSVDEKVAGEMIQLTSVKWNAVNLGDSYYIAEYSIRLSFEENSYQFEPTAIRLKLNSKYDMGWEEFDLTDGGMYFKKGKLVKKYKAYLKGLMVRLNKLDLELDSYLIAD